jgi:predicted permease
VTIVPESIDYRSPLPPDPDQPPRALLSIIAIATWTAPLAIFGHVAVNGFDADAPAGAMLVALVAAGVAILMSLIALAFYRPYGGEWRTTITALVVGIASVLAMFVMPSIHH